MLYEFGFAVSYQHRTIKKLLYRYLPSCKLHVQIYFLKPTGLVSIVSFSTEPLFIIIIGHDVCSAVCKEGAALSPNRSSLARSFSELLKQIWSKESARLTATIKIKVYVYYTNLFYVVV